MRALLRDARVVILDEPTAALTPRESNALYATLRRMADTGRAVVVVTHRLDEVREHADHVSVLRRGRLVSSRAVAARDEAAFRAMARDVMGGAEPPRSPAAARILGDVRLELREARRTPRLRGVTLSVRAGEIVGVAGVDGNGQRELVRVLVLLLMHGVTASGKSWVSEQLIGTLGAVRMRSDLERRRPGDAGDYSAAARERTYRRLLDCAESTLAGGCHAIVDATFLDRAARQPFEALARRRQCPMLIVSCHAERATLEARLRERARRAVDPSEATLAVLQAQLPTAQALSEQELTCTVPIDTGSPAAIAAGIGSLKARLQHAMRANPASLAR